MASRPSAEMESPPKDIEDSLEFKDPSLQAIVEQPSRLHYLEIENKNEIPLWLAPCHLVAALFQGMQAVFLFAFSTQTDMQWLVYTNYASTPIDELLRDEYAKPEPKEINSFSITWYAAVFILLSCLDHVSSIVPLTRKQYEYNIQRHQSPTRWVEYSLSASLMRMLIGHVAGVTDAHLLFMIFICAHVTMYFALFHEKLNAKARADGYDQDWSPFWLGFVPHMAPWVVIGTYFFSGVAQESPPGYVFAIAIALFLLDLSFPIVFILQWAKVGIFSDYIIGEFMLIVCSFTSKTVLAWLTLAGANRFVRNA